MRSRLGSALHRVGFSVGRISDTWFRRLAFLALERATIEQIPEIRNTLQVVRVGMRIFCLHLFDDLIVGQLRFVLSSEELADELALLEASLLASVREVFRLLHLDPFCLRFFGRTWKLVIIDFMRTTSGRLGIGPATMGTGI